MTMREKMARALFTQNEDSDITWDTCPQEIRDEHLASADAALAAMDEPTEVMVKAADAFQNVRGVWQSMIGAAKAE